MVSQPTGFPYVGRGTHTQGGWESHWGGGAGIMTMSSSLRVSVEAVVAAAVSVLQPQPDRAEVADQPQPLPPLSALAAGGAASVAGGTHREYDSPFCPAKN